MTCRHATRGTRHRQSANVPQGAADGGHHEWRRSQSVNASGLDCRVSAQDSAGTEATDNITEQVQRSAGAKANTLVLPGDVISAVGTKAKSRSDDVSPPGLVIAIRSSSGPTGYE